MNRMMFRPTANSLEDRGSIPGWIISKTQKGYLMTACWPLTIISYVSRFKWSNRLKRLGPSPTSLCRSYLLHTHNIRMCEIDMGNLKKWKILRLLSSGTIFFITFELKGFSTWGERDTIFLCWLLLHRQLSNKPTRGARSARKSSGLAQLWKSTFFFRGGNSTNCFFSNLSPRFRCVTLPKYNWSQFL